MKTKILPLITCIIFTGYTVNSFAQANTSLSNLTSPTAVNVNLLPDKDNKHNLGSLNKAWRNLYLDSSIYLAGTKFVSFTSGTGTANTAIGSAALNANTTGYSNTGVGFNVLFNNTTGSQNTASGYQALFSNTTGTANIAYGDDALYKNTSGYWNVAIGGNSLFLNSTANGNVAIGYNTLYSNTTGYSNVAIGINALRNNQTGHNLVAVGDSALFHQIVNNDFYYTNTTNTAVGSKSLYSNTDGNYNTASGCQALYKNTTGSLNTALGDQALYENTTGQKNTATGEEALFDNTTGSENTATGSEALAFNTTGYDNTATGRSALVYNSTGHGNTATGAGALEWNTTGSYNTAVGEAALSSSNFSTSANNTALGYSAGSNITDGSSNTFVGYNANCGTGGHITNATIIGNGATATTNNHVRIGNSSVTSIGGYANWTNISDGRVKKNIKSNIPGLTFINKLKPITYNLDLDAADKIIQPPAIKDKDGKVKQPSQEELTARKEKQQIIYSGFIAQDVEKAAKELNYDFSGVDAAKNDKDLYGLRYAEFVVPLVKAVQELSAKNDSLQKQNADFEKRIEALESTMKLQQSTIASSQSTTISSASLEQNIPNPFNHTTTIRYAFPKKEL